MICNEDKRGFKKNGNHRCSLIKLFSIPFHRALSRISPPFPWMDNRSRVPERNCVRFNGYFIRFSELLPVKLISPRAAAITIRNGARDFTQISSDRYCVFKTKVQSIGGKFFLHFKKKKKERKIEATNSRRREFEIFMIRVF